MYISCASRACTAARHWKRLACAVLTAVRNRNLHRSRSPSDRLWDSSARSRGNKRFRGSASSVVPLAATADELAGSAIALITSCMLKIARCAFSALCAAVTSSTMRRICSLRKACRRSTSALPSTSPVSSDQMRWSSESAFSGMDVFTKAKARQKRSSARSRGVSSTASEDPPSGSCRSVSDTSRSFFQWRLAARIRTVRGEAWSCSGLGTSAPLSTRKSST
mmetsp:Transcript_10388/g.39304  ORF Transcript_10388/g.39304 Transcript_10388/m.39304 type:complete len:222 (-) Transcript_10388:248-913(-)